MGAMLSATILAGASSHPATGQIGAPTSCPTLSCRAVAPFHNCDKPLDDRAVFKARVVNVEEVGCLRVLSFDIMRPSELNLPSRIQVDLGGCAYWAGKFGDIIDVAVRPHLANQRVYALACNLF